MSLMGKLLVIADIGQQTYGRWLFQRLLPGILLIVGLSIMIAIMVSALVMGGLYLAYGALIAYGADPQLATITITTAAVLIIALLVYLIRRCLYHMRHVPQEALKQSPLNYCTIGTLGAFLQGLMSD